MLPPGYRPADIVGIAHSAYVEPGQGMGVKTLPAVYVFYRDGRYSVGVSNNLAKFQITAQYELPPGKQPQDIVGVSYSEREGMTWEMLNDHKDMAFFAFYSARDSRPASWTPSASPTSMSCRPASPRATSSTSTSLPTPGITSPGTGMAPSARG